MSSEEVKVARLTNSMPYGVWAAIPERSYRTILLENRIVFERVLKNDFHLCYPACGSRASISTDICAKFILKEG